MDSLAFIVAGAVVILAAGVWIDDLTEFVFISGPKNTRWILRNVLLLAVLLLAVLNGVVVVANTRAKNQLLTDTRKEFGNKVGFLKKQIKGISLDGTQLLQDHRYFSHQLATNLVVEPSAREAILDSETNLQALYVGVTNLDAWVTKWDERTPAVSPNR